jgi:multicomponent Na+:H+ antiporter subunit D
VWLGLLSTGLAVALAASAWFAHLLPDRVLRGMRRVVEPPVRVLHRLHSGHVGDYVAWLVFGVALLGALIAV